ncbi:MAG TPA: hypothetical protein VIN58_07580 [Roseateles sp.]
MAFGVSTVHADDSRTEQSFDAKGIKRVVLRSANAKKALVEVSEVKRVTITGRAEGGAQGYHSPDLNWKETPAADWGMKFVAKWFGTDMVVSSQNEIGYIHHVYTVDGITITLPEGVQLVREDRVLSGSGEPDLRAP